MANEKTDAVNHQSVPPKNSDEQNIHLSPLQASLLLYFGGLFVLIYLVGIVLNGLNRLPPHVTDFAVQIFGGGGFLALCLTIYGLFKSDFYKSIWQNARRLLSILLSIVTVMSLTALVLWVPFLQPHPSPYPPYSGTLSLSDSLTRNDQSAGWYEGSYRGNADIDSCHFAQTGYISHVAVSGHYEPCPATNTSFSNFAYEVQMTIEKGDAGGIFFRANVGENGFGAAYIFTITVNGDIAIFRVDQNGSSTTLLNRHSNYFTPGVGKANLVAVVANGSEIDFYINHHPIAHLADSTYQTGQIGVAALDYQNVTDVVFTKANVWQL